MSKLVDRFQEPVFAASIVATIVLTLVFKFYFELNWVVSFIISGLVSGAAYIFYQDYVEKQRLEDAAQEKEKDLQRRIKEQAEEELKSGKCVSCTAEIPDGAEECPKCGYPVKHYSSVES